MQIKIQQMQGVAYAKHTTYGHFIANKDFSYRMSYVLHMQPLAFVTFYLFNNRIHFEA